MAALLSTIFFVSGASALIFEALWFRQAGLAFGNSIWASSLVLSGFMGGLALGNTLAARYGVRIGRPLRVYGLAEVAIGLTGVGLVYLFPVLGTMLAPWLRPLLDRAWILNPIRLFIAFLLLLVPSTAMGITLPLLTRVLAAYDTHFGRVLGRLYGWNTLGAVTGVVIGEAYLVGELGVRGTALAAGALNLVVAAVALWLSTGAPAASMTTARAEPPVSRHVGAALWIAAAFLSGFCLLALELVWFRFLLLFVSGHSLALALMLGVVLAGIALGGLTASLWLRLASNADRVVSALAFSAGLLCVISYAAFPAILQPLSSAVIKEPLAILRLGVPLMLPVSYVSGIFFALLGAALRRELSSDTETAGVLTLANTIGAALGSLSGGFLLLPMLGIERSFLAIAVLYGIIGVLLLPTMRRPRWAAYATAGALLLSILLFPFGSLETGLVQISVKHWVDGDARVAAVREGLTETIIYFQRLMLGKPLSYVMLTNSYSMSANGYGVRRYQKLYVYWPMAVHPHLRRALLIGYGVGNTAKAMTDSESIETIDIVDLSPDILEMNRVVYPEGSGLPLNDPRVHLHIEDGRYFLQTTDRSFDLITGEPPPPGIAGVENLYSREYFQLIHDRLADGGIVTYWLPLSELTDVSSKTILRAFCAVFEDCSLWNGSGTNLMMIGTRNASGPVSEEHFTRQWRTPTVAAEMRRLGLEQPEQLGALFIGDAEYLEAFTDGSPVLVDNYPKLIEAPFSSPQEPSRFFETLADVNTAAARFQRSPLIRRLWPPQLVTASIASFTLQDAINAFMYGTLIQRPQAIEQVHRVLAQSSSSAPVLWRLGSNSDIQHIVETATPDELANPLLQFHLGVRLLSERRYLAAAEALSRAEELTDRVTAPGASLGENAFALHMYALCMGGRTTEAQAEVSAAFSQSLRDRGLTAASVTEASLPPFWRWMKQTFGIDPVRP